MRSTFTGLNTMVKGIFSNQLSLDTVGHNITNANTEGYSRQSVNLAATRCQMQPTIYGEQAVGTGVDSTSILRARDIFADKQYRMEVATQEYNNVMQRNYENIETTFYDTQDSGIQNALQDFWKSLQDLSINASDNTVRKNVTNKGIYLADMIHRSKDDLIDHINLLYNDLEARIDNINELTSKVAHINKQIVAMEANGSSANDLRDQRDKVVDDLAEFLDLTVYENPEGSYSVISNGVTLVNANETLTLELSVGHSSLASDVNYGVTDYHVTVRETGTVFMPKDGGVRGIIDSIEENKFFIGELANISAMLLTTFNDQHRAGYDMNGDQACNFFGSYENTYSEYRYGEFRYNPKSADADYFYVYNGDKILTGVDIIEELQVNTKISASDGGQYIAAKNDDNLTGADLTATAQGNNAVLLSNLFEMTKEYTETTSPLISSKYRYYSDGTAGKASTIFIYNDDATYTTVTGVTYTTVTSSQIVYQGQDGVIYRQVTTVRNNETGELDETRGSGPIFVDQHGYKLNVSVSEVTVGETTTRVTTYTTTTASGRVSYSQDSPGMLIYLDKNGNSIYRSINEDGSVAYYNNGNTILYKNTITNADGSLTILFAGEENVTDPQNATYVVYSSISPIRALGELSIFNYYDYSMSQLGLRAESMDLKVESQDELIVQIQNWRSSTAGVDWNEELTNMIKFQKGYGACARCLTAMDEMLDRLVNNTGQVGR